MIVSQTCVCGAKFHIEIRQDLEESETIIFERLIKWEESHLCGFQSVSGWQVKNKWESEGIPTNDH